MDYISCADTAKLVRQALKAAFPGVKFSVRSSVYSGGASIDVRWTDGPLRKEVEPIAKQYQGSDFDGMIDMKVSSSHYLRPDGSVFLRHAPGTGDSHGSIPGEDNRALSRVMPPDVRAVRFMADYISCRRDITNEAAQIAEGTAYIRAHCNCDGDRFGNQWVSNLGSQLAFQRKEGESWEAVFRREILREELLR